jgi:hypothetical protein
MSHESLFLENVLLQTAPVGDFHAAASLYPLFISRSLLSGATPSHRWLGTAGTIGRYNCYTLLKATREERTLYQENS